MKKKLLILAAMIATLLCVFALAVSAKTVQYEGRDIELIDNLGDPTWYTGDTATAIQDKESIVILKDANNNMKAYPAYYILKYRFEYNSDNTIKHVGISWADKGGVTYDWLNEQAGTSYTSGSIYYIEFPYGITKCYSNSIFGGDFETKPECNVVEIHLPATVREMEGQSFRRMNSCKKINIPAAVTTIPSWTFCGSAALETVVFDEGSQLVSTGKCFADCSSLSSINLEACTVLDTLGNNTFTNCTSLNTLTLPDSIRVIEDAAFYKMGTLTLTSDYLPKNLKVIGSFDANGNGSDHFFSGCQLTNSVLYFPEGFTSFHGDYSFNDGFYVNHKMTLVFLGKMTEIDLAHQRLDQNFKGGLEIILANNTYDELAWEILQGVNYNGTAGYVGKMADGSAPYTVKTGSLVIKLCNNDPNTASELGKDENGNTVYNASTAPASVVFCGGDKVEFCYSVRNSFTDKGWYRFFTTPFAYDMQAHTTANKHYDKIVVESLVSCGYDGVTTNTCVLCDRVASVVVPATNRHTYTVDYDCTTAHSCTVCEKLVVAALEHVTSKSYLYENGYTVKGVIIDACTNEGCSHKKIAELAPLFVNKGYTKEEGTNGSSIAYGIQIDRTAIATYENATGKKVSYGFIVGMAPNAPTGDIVNSNGESLLQNTVAVDFTTIEQQTFTIYNVKLTDIKTDAQKALSIYCNAYVIVNDQVSYIGEAETQKAVAVTYNNLPVKKEN